jgi:3'-phosphoadenosine 5'-phosphosulfate sulfotransferase (PAPS reductase)/FAD synthetase
MDKKAINKIRELFVEDHPLFVSWSGGKDSSVVLDLALQAALDAKNKDNARPKMFITHADTKIENPEVALFCKKEISKIESFCFHNGLDGVSVHVCEPSLAFSWVVRVIGGRTLPVFANKTTRECSIDFKKKPQDKMRKKLLREIIGKNLGFPITLVGTRFEESASRKARMEGRGESSSDVWVARMISPCFHPLRIGPQLMCGVISMLETVLQILIPILWVWPNYIRPDLPRLIALTVWIFPRHVLDARFAP